MADTPIPDLDQLGHSILGRLFDVLTAGDGDVTIDEQNFFAWRSVGIPIPDDYLDFAAGLGSDGAEQQRRTALAEEFAVSVDFIPNVDGVVEGQTQIAGGVKRLSSEFERVLRMCEVADDRLTEDEQANLERLMGLLVVERTEKDIVTEEEKTVTVDSPLVETYNEKRQAYLQAAESYNNMRLAALRQDVEDLAADFRFKGPNARLKVRAALDDWESAGRRNDVDRVRAAIAQITGRSMVLHLRRVRERIEMAKQAAPLSGGEFLYTSITPSTILQSAGWSNYMFTTSSAETYKNERSNKWSAKAGLDWKFFKKASGEAERESVSSKETIDTRDFELSFEITEAPIMRGWFSPEFFDSRGWRLPNDELLSDGGDPPDGTLVAYPETVIFVRNLKLSMAELQKEDSEVKKSFEAGGGGSFGPFSLGGEYESAGETERQESKQTGQGIEVDGAQVIGYRCHVLGKTPNPAESVENWT